MLLKITRKQVFFMLFLYQILEHKNTYKNRDFDSLGILSRFTPFSAEYKSEQIRRDYEYCGKRNDCEHGEGFECLDIYVSATAGCTILTASPFLRIHPEPKHQAMQSEPTVRAA